MHILLKEIINTFKIDKEMSSVDVNEILCTVKPYSMVHETGILFAMASAVYAIKANITGVIVECGVWRGGCALAMLLIQRKLFGKVLKPVYMLDSFAGLPPVDQRDGPLAAHWQTGADSDTFFDNCKAGVSELRSTLESYDISSEDYSIVQGWFEDTVPRIAPQIADKRIAVLRLDSDWYASTKLCLDSLCHLTEEEGVVIIDDYYAWDGCSKAVHDYVASTGLPYRIKSLPYNFGAYFIKRLQRNTLNQF